jgi:hypothetical protein
MFGREIFPIKLLNAKLPYIRTLPISLQKSKGKKLHIES